jgi:iron(III) transport system substrate-binding protein
VDVAGRASADLFVANSVADIWAFAEDDELRPVYSAVVDANIDTSLRDSESRWVGLATRARIVIYNDTLVTDDEVATLQNYASLRDERWRGRLCLSSSRSGGNRLLIAHLINTHGVREAETIARGWRANLATTIFADDDALLAAMAAGDCAIGIADSNRIYAIPGSTDVSAHWFSAPDATVIDASVAAVSRHANDAAGAQQMLEWLTTPTPNALFAIRQLDLPANADAPSSSTVADLPVTRGSAPVPLSELGFLLEEADLLRERARYP